MHTNSKQLFAFVICFVFFKVTYSQSCKRWIDSAAALYNSDGSEKALPVARQACEECLKQKGEDSSYVIALKNFATIEADIDMAKALGIYKQAYATNLKIKGRRNKMTADILDDISTMFAELDSSVRYANEAKSIIGDLYTENSYEYADCFNRLAKIYVEAGEYGEAENLIMEAGQIEMKLPNFNKNPVSLRTMNIGAVICHEKGNYDLSLQLYEYLIPIYELKKSADPVPWLSAKNNLAAVYVDLQLFDKAADIFKDILQELEKYGTGNDEYLTTLSNLSSTYSMAGHNEKSLEIDDKVLAQTKGTNLNQYALTLDHEATTYGYLKNFPKAIDLLKESIAIRKKISAPNSDLLVTCLHNLASCYRDNGQYGKSSCLADTIVEMVQKNYSNKSPSYGSYLGQAALDYWANGAYEKTGNLLRLLGENLSYQVKNTLHGLNEKERNGLIDNFYTSFQYLASFVSFKNQQRDDGYNGWLYNLELMRKNLLLSSSKTFLNSMLETKDTSLNKFFKRWKLLKQQLTQDYLLPVAERPKNLDSLENVVGALERKIAYQSSEFKNSMQAETLDWKAIQNLLKPDEASIELIKYDEYNGKEFSDSTRFAALIIRPGLQQPVWVPLFEARTYFDVMKSLNRILDDEEKIKILYGTSKNANASNTLYQLTWKPLINTLNGVRKIYFAPVSVLNNISFFALKDGSGKFLTEQFDLVQLGSTRDIVELKQHDFFTIKPGMRSAVFGGIAYNENSIVQSFTRSKASGNGFLQTQPKVFKRDIVDGSTWPSLPGSLLEAKNLYSILQGAKIQVALYDSVNASEENFKNLSGDDAPDILHIATHGFYYEKSGVDARKVYTHSLQQTIRYNSDPLIRSGLVMASANLVWTGRQPLKGRDDGILTGAEIADLNLQKTSLVVLSACRTGLGDLKGDETANGLQRAFRLAGAKNMIMSLWRISDTKTPVFMQLFYQYLAEGMNIHDAFRQTQLKMSHQYDPYYWAAFILVN